MILLDTHVMIWSLEGPSRLGPRATALIEHANEDGALFISPISGWEVAMLVSKGRLRLTQPPQLFMETVFARPSVALAEVTSAIAVAAGELVDLHGDPADRFLIATARALDAVLLTADELILSYAEQGILKAADARC